MPCRAQLRLLWDTNILRFQVAILKCSPEHSARLAHFCEHSFQIIPPLFYGCILGVNFIWAPDFIWQQEGIQETVVCHQPRIICWPVPAITNLSVLARYLWRFKVVWLPYPVHTACFPFVVPSSCAYALLSYLFVHAMLVTISGQDYQGQSTAGFLTKHALFVAFGRVDKYLQDISEAWYTLWMAADLSVARRPTGTQTGPASSLPHAHSASKEFTMKLMSPSCSIADLQCPRTRLYQNLMQHTVLTKLDANLPCCSVDRCFCLFPD